MRDLLKHDGRICGLFPVCAQKLRLSSMNGNLLAQLGLINIRMVSRIILPRNVKTSFQKKFFSVTGRFERKDEGLPVDGKTEDSVDGIPRRLAMGSVLSEHPNTPRPTHTCRLNIENQHVCTEMDKTIKGLKFPKTFKITSPLNFDQSRNC